MYKITKVNKILKRQKEIKRGDNPFLIERKEVKRNEKRIQRQ